MSENRLLILLHDLVSLVLLLIYLFIFILTQWHFFVTLRQRKGERKGEKHPWEREASIQLPPSTHLDQGSNLQPRHVPWWGIKPSTLQLQDTPTNWATLARAVPITLMLLSSINKFQSPIHFTNTEYMCSKKIPRLNFTQEFQK